MLKISVRPMELEPKQKITKGKKKNVWPNSILPVFPTAAAQMVPLQLKRCYGLQLLFFIA